MADMQLANFKPDSAGISQIFRSSGMQAVVTECASKITDQANSICVGRRGGLSNKVYHGIKEHDGAAFREDPYYYEVTVGHDDTFAVVKANTLEGAHDMKANHTLLHFA